MSAQKKNPNMPEIEGDEEGSMILEEEIDENYEPTQEEIIEYAQFLGMDLKQDKEFFYIAREGLKAPLPEIWKPAKNRSGDIYYINLQTKQTQWEHPCDEYYKKLFQEAKKKKAKGPEQKQSPPKFKTNLSENKQGSPKVGGLPVIKELTTMKSDMSSENALPDSSSLEPTPKILINNKPIEKHTTAPVKNLGSILSEIKDDYTITDDQIKIDREYEEKVATYRQEKEKDLKGTQRHLKSRENSRDKELQGDLAQDLDDFRAGLLKKIQTNKQDWVREKEKLKEDLTNEYKKKTEFAILKADQEHNNSKMKTEMSESQDLEKFARSEEERIMKDFEKKIIELTKTKKEAESEKLKQLEDQDQKEIDFQNAVEKEKKKAIEDYQRQLTEFESKEIKNQRKELEDYRNELKLKLNGEETALSIASKQKQSINLARENELKEIYDRKFEFEKARIDDDSASQLQNYEETAKGKKDEAIKGLQTMEFKLEKDKKQLTFKKELDTLKDNYSKRLASYEAQLKEKLENEKRLVDQEMTNTLERHQLDVDNISLNLDDKDEIMDQITKTQEKNDEVSHQIIDMSKKVDQQRVDNQRFKNKIEELKIKVKVQNQTNALSLISELEKKVKDAEFALKQLKKPSILKSTNFSPDKKPTVIISPKGSSIKPNTPLAKVIEDIEELKSIMAKKDEPERMSKSIHFRSNSSIKLTSPKNLGVGMERNSQFRSSKTSLKQESQDKWTRIYVTELDYVAELKERIEECKTMLMKRQANLVRGQEKFKRSLQEYKSLDSKTPQKKQMLKKLKESLDEETRHIHENVSELKEADILLEKKERLLAELGRLARRMDISMISPGKINRVYENYLAIDIQIPHIEEEKYASFYDNWNNIIEDQLTLDNELSESENNYDGGSRKSLVKQRTEPVNPSPNKNLTSRNISEPLSSTKSPRPMQLSYNNFMKVLDFQPESDLQFSESVMIKKHFSDVRRERSNVKDLLSSHSDWLKDMKQKLNHQLYDKPASSASRTSTMF